MEGEEDDGWKWSDKEYVDKRSGGKNKLKEIGKIILFFADEALLILIIAYILYRVFT